MLDKKLEAETKKYAKLACDTKHREIESKTSDSMIVDTPVVPICRHNSAVNYARGPQPIST